MRIEETFRAQQVLLYAPPPKSPETGKPREVERVLNIVPPSVYVEYDKRGREIEHRYGGRSWVC